MLEKPRKIIHVDMDCFFAAIEIRDNPALKDKPVAVGGSSRERGVVCTCNYIARQYGIHSAMSTAMAYQRCRNLIVLPVNMKKYKTVAKAIHQIFREFTDLVEPLSLDEAYLDVTDATEYKGSATLIAKAIKQRILETQNLIASAGVAPNKFLAKVASGWKKPNGLFVITPAQISSFVKTLPVTDLYGVGRVTAEKLHKMNLKDCTDLQKLSLPTLATHFGKMGKKLYEQCRGLDYRSVEPNKIRKSLSVEKTFTEDIRNVVDVENVREVFAQLYERLAIRIKESAPERKIKSQYVKVKFSSFTLRTAETISNRTDLEKYLALFQQILLKNKEKNIRLLGLGVHFYDDAKIDFFQPSLFDLG